MSSAPSPPLIHNEAAHRFQTDGTAPEDTSVLEYNLDAGAGKIIFTHTFVPPSQRNLGLAAKLVTLGLDYARQQGLRVVPLCSYVDHYITRHPEYADLR